MNPLTLATLRCLSASRHVSGESIAAALDVTRATVWNAIREAGAAGVAIERVRGLGYRLAHECTWLDADLIAAALGAQRQRFALEVVPATGSTNSDLLARAAAGAAGGQVIAAEWQAGGRGRRGRGWVNPLGGALTFSLLWRFERGVAALSGLSLVVGLACARALRATGAPDVGVKWPNDLQVDGRKLGGILIELQGDALGPSAAVIGIGINVRLPAEAAARVDQPVADLHGAGGITDRNRLLAILLQELAAALDEFTVNGFAPFAEAFGALHVLQDRTVDVALGDSAVVTGVVEGVDAHGALRVATAGGLRLFHGGEVSVRRAVDA
jgi:BirA family biotin operon repressor/biotin-[acetyl-CoA-carboxylase] ligase